MATKKAPVKKKTTAKTTAKKKSAATKTPNYETLKLTKKDVPFFKTNLTVQTFYWTIIAFLILILGLWIINLQYEVQNLYNQLETEQAQNTPLKAPKK